MKTKNTRKGFTTVELVIVIAVIAILATVLIPTFSNMIEKANLSVDTQNVRNMNVCLQTYIMADEPEAFGTVQKRLAEFGYTREKSFTPKTDGYSFRWYSVDNVILFVDDAGRVVFLEEYKGLENRTVDINKTPNDPSDDISGVVDNEGVCFDLSLPGAEVIKNNNPGIMVTVDGEEKPLAVMYTFNADSEERQEYRDWLADFYISFDEAITCDDDIALAGNYGDYGWISMRSKDLLEPNQTLPANYKYKLPITGQGVPYWELQSMVGIFKCGVVDTPDADDNIVDKGIKLTVELRLTNPKNEDDFVLIGVFNYTFQ